MGSPAGQPLDADARALLRQQRERFGFSRRQLAELVGCHINTVVCIETGKKHPSRAMLNSMCSHLALTWRAPPIEIRHLPIPDESYYFVV